MTRISLCGSQNIWATLLLLLGLLQFIHGHQYITYHNLFIPAEKAAVLNLTMYGDEKNSVSWTNLELSNNWMYPSGAFDVVVTSSKDEKDKIINPSESCQLLSGETYTYRTSFTQNFTSENKTEMWVIILNNQRIAPKSMIQDLFLNVKITYNVSKQGKIYDIGTFVLSVVMLSLWIFLNLKHKKMKKQVEICEALHQKEKETGDKSD